LQLLGNKSDLFFKSCNIAAKNKEPKRKGGEKSKV
jgi:hypothetical protein